MESIKSRRSVQKYATQKPDWRDIIECVDAARYAPMAGNIFTPRFILIKNEKTIKKLADAAQQDFIENAHWVVVVCSDTRRTLNSYGQERGERYIRQQVGAAIQNFLLKIQEKGLVTCWVGHFVDDNVRTALNIPEGILIEAMFPIGIPSKAKGQTPLKPRKKVDIDTMLFFEKYKQKRISGIPFQEV